MRQRWLLDGYRGSLPRSEPLPVASQDAVKKMDAGGRSVRRFSIRRIDCLLLFAILLGCNGAFASPVLTALTGRVSTDDASAEGVTVSLRSPALMQPRATTTGPSGSYWLVDLPAGAYEVTFSRAGLQTLTRRVVIEVARVSRVDARLESSEDEESVTSTATTIAMAETTPITSHFTDRGIDRLPLNRTMEAMSEFAPGESSGRERRVIDDAFAPRSLRLGGEAIEQITIVRGALPVEYSGRETEGIVTRTRSGGEAYFLSLRDTITTRGGTAHLFESAGGGSIIPRQLWFFAAGWAGDDRLDHAEDLRGLLIKLSAQPASRHHLTLQYMESNAAAGERPRKGSLAALRYTGQAGDRLTLTTVASHSASPDTADPDGTALFARSSYFLPTRRGDHLLTAGGTASGAADDSLFVNDRWSYARWTFDLGIRHQRGLQPRAAVAWDVAGDGRHGAFLSYSETENHVREMTAGYATAIGASGIVRGDLIRRRDGELDPLLLQLEGAYRLFDRFELGGNYSWADVTTAGSGSSHSANAWFGAELPRDSHILGFTLLQRYYGTVDSAYKTDLALRYIMPIARTRVTVAADLLDLFDDQEARLWIRLRI
jgi:hypothetical protein